jgi:hypothetical protein
MAKKKPKKKATKKAAAPKKPKTLKKLKPVKKAKKAKKASTARKAAPVARRARPKKRAVAAAKKSPAPAKPKKAAPPPRAKPLRRRAAPGHIDPKYGAELLARSGPPNDEGQSFLVKPRSRDDMAEERGEEFVETVTTGEYEGEETLNQVVDEETGGPFVETSGAIEFAEGTDASNPEDAKREPFPKT